jgi:2-oxoisovalerate dehydrogenase E2 component (dihydrolipoyl transacylase)
VAGEVGDQIAIGSVLVVFETEAGAGASAPTLQQEGTETTENGERTDTVALGDGLVAPTPAQEQAIPSAKEEQPSPPARPEPVESAVSSTPAPSGETSGKPKLKPKCWHPPLCASGPAISAST